MIQHRADVPESGASDPLIELIVSEPGMAERLLAEHADDGAGRCRCCSGGSQTPHFPWPCTLYHYAVRAQRFVAAR